jgi:hypothetical protein
LVPQYGYLLLLLLLLLLLFYNVECLGAEKKEEKEKLSTAKDGAIDF